MLTTSFPRHHDDYAGVFVYELAAAMVTQNIQVTVVAPHHAGLPRTEVRGGVTIKRFRYFYPARLQRVAYGGGLPANLSKSLITWIELPFFFLGFIMASLPLARRADVIHAHWLASAFVGLIAKWIYGKRLIVTVQGSDMTLGRHSRLLFLIRAFILKRADQVIVVSRELKDMVDHVGVPPGKIIEVPNGIVHFDSLNRLPLKHRNTNTVLWVGRLTNEKNVFLMLRVFKMIIKSIPAAKLIIVGDGPLRSSAERLAVSLQVTANVSFVGTQPLSAMPQWYDQADVVVSTSRREGLPLTVLEAMAAGRPVIAPAIGGIKDVIIHQTNGLLYTGDDEQSIASLIVGLLADGHQRDTLAQAARRSMGAEYQWPTIARRTLAAYRI